MPAKGMHNATLCEMTENCEGCDWAIPRYLCVNVVVSHPGTGTGSGSGTSNDVCCRKFGFRVLGGKPSQLVLNPDDTTSYQVIPGSTCGWAGSGNCVVNEGQQVSLSLELRIVRVYGDCYTKVICPQLLAEPLYFHGVAGHAAANGNPAAEPIEFSGVDNVTGATFSVEVLRTGTSVNALAHYICSPCKCAGCVPTRFCVNLTMWPPVGGLSCGYCVHDAIFTCVGKEWVSDTPLVCGTETYTLTLRLPEQDEVDRGCAIIGRLSGGRISQLGIDGHYHPGYDFLIALEHQLKPVPDPDLPPDSYICIEPADNNLTRRFADKSRQLNPLTMQPDILSYHDAVKNDTGAQIGTFSLRELPCDEDCSSVVSGCWGDCEDIVGIVFPNTGTCPPVTLHATAIAPGKSFDGTTFALTENTCFTTTFPFATTTTTCTNFCGSMTIACPGGGGTTGKVSLRYKNRRCKETAEDHPDKYFLVYSFGSVSCVSTGIGPGVYQGEKAPSEASCSPFQIDFLMPPFCKGITVSGVVVLVPLCDGDTTDDWILRITL